MSEDPLVLTEVDDDNDDGDDDVYQDDEEYDPVSGWLNFDYWCLKLNDIPERG